ncbi:acyl-ACP--UDP-N-acetylglucosamine O-acyltransferase [Pseudanabaena sp. PCC 6802]|uniref:acyl-ACP--UDP-N-acetylglucosamine O-acyltransferase n=1 Tax=Pseudanabaena sp. PCC 6802 TaxID=118173 RepID=UPI00034ACC25|nr:acyl-ACP--UDP-N-acetylglucosamine O-acyltransferase [Pseudanabaena sp. PCC 6802]
MPVSHVPLPQLIHPTAIVHPGAEVHPTVQIGAYSVIGEKVKIGAHTVVGAHVVIDGWTEIGDRNHIFPGAAIGLEPQDLKYNGAASLVKIGNNNRIREYVTINRATGDGEVTSIGSSNLLMAYVHVAHNCAIADNVIITNSVALAGHIVIESGARIGGIVGIHQFVHVGQMAMIGGMSRIERDVPPFMVVEGNPSRVRAINRIGLERAGLEPEDLQLIKQAYRILYRQDFTLPEALEKLASLPENSHVMHLQKFLKASLSEGRRGPIPGRN